MKVVVTLTKEEVIEAVAGYIEGEYGFDGLNITSMKAVGFVESAFREFEFEASGSDE